MHIPSGGILRAIGLLINWLKVTFGGLLPPYPRFQTHADKPFTPTQLQELADHINGEYAGHYVTYTPENILAWLDVCPEIYQVVFDRVLFRERVVACCKVLPLTDEAIRKIFDGSFESIEANRDDLAPSFDAATGLWIGDLIVSKPYRVFNSGDAVSKSLLLHLKTLLKPFFGKKFVFARTERDDIVRLMINKGFIPCLRGSDEVTGKTPFVLFKNGYSCCRPCSSVSLCRP